MRSDERSGAVFAVLILLWGTLLAEPLHIYTHYIRKIVVKAAGLLNMEYPSIAVNLSVCVVMVLLGCLFIKLSETHFAPYIATLLCILTAVGYIINSIIDKDMSVICLITFAASLGVLGIFHVTGKDTLLMWGSDMFIFSHAVYIIANLMLIPVSRLGDTAKKILYITNYSDADLSAPFDGLIRMPAAVWGSFITILALIPMVYLALTRRKA